MEFMIIWSRSCPAQAFTMLKFPEFFPVPQNSTEFCPAPVPRRALVQTCDQVYAIYTLLEKKSFPLLSLMVNSKQPITVEISFAFQGTLTRIRYSRSNIGDCFELGCSFVIPASQRFSTSTENAAGGEGVLHVTLSFILHPMLYPLPIMNSMKLVIPLHSLYWSIHTKDESKCGTVFAFIFGVN